MTDNQLIQLFLPIIQAQLIVDGFTNVIVQQMDQPTQQGIPTTPTVYFQKVYNHRYGWGIAYPKWDTVSQTMVLHEDQWHETSFQVSALYIQNPITPNQFTAADLANEVAYIMQSQKTLIALMAQNVGLLRIENINNPYRQDDRDQFEALPSFDFILTHLESRVSIVRRIRDYVVNLQRE